MRWASTDMCGILHLCLCLCLLCQSYHIICAFLLVPACPADETDLVCASACAALAQLLQADAEASRQRAPPALPPAAASVLSGLSDTVHKRLGGLLGVALARFRWVET